MHTFHCVQRFPCFFPRLEVNKAVIPEFLNTLNFAILRENTLNNILCGAQEKIADVENFNLCGKSNSGQAEWRLLQVLTCRTKFNMLDFARVLIISSTCHIYRAVACAANKQ